MRFPVWMAAAVVLAGWAVATLGAFLEWGAITLLVSGGTLIGAGLLIDVGPVRKEPR